MASSRPIALWVLSVCAMIVLMVAIGGITRVTHSGLSIVDWQPLIGAVPPLTHEQWSQAFSRYQLHPEYRLLYPDMTLGQFKGLFFWEYLHRLVARLIGAVVLVPALLLAWRGHLSRPVAARMGTGLLLGGLQGAMGWFMVKSGLDRIPHVSHYRLAAHLLLALAILAYFFWYYLDLTRPASEPGGARAPALRPLGRALLALVVAQIFYGALTAGLKAGLGFNTFPKMNGSWLPETAWALAPAWLNLFANSATVQFVHRSLAWLVAVSTLSCFAVAWTRLPAGSRARGSTARLLIAVGVQFGLGILTLLRLVPPWLAVLHQLGACAVFLAALELNHSL